MRAWLSVCRKIGIVDFGLADMLCGKPVIGIYTYTRKIKMACPQIPLNAGIDNPLYKTMSLEVTYEII